jgi:WD40 repeat protein
MASPALPEVLSPSLRVAFGWARTIETIDEIGTRTVLIGMIRAEPLTSEPALLVRLAGASLGTLYEALQEAEPAARLSLDPIGPGLFSGREPVSRNLGEALKFSDTRRKSRSALAGQIMPEDLFAGMLAIPWCSACRGLQSVLEGVISLADLGKYLEADPTHTVEEWLASHFTGQRARSSPSILRGDAPALKTNEEHRLSIDGFGVAVQALALSPDGETVVGAYTGDPRVRVWMLGSSPLEQPSLRVPDLGTALAFAPDGIAFAIAEASTVNVARMTSEGTYWLADHSRRSAFGAPVAVAFAPDGERVAATTRAGTVEIKPVVHGLGTALLRSRAPLLDLVWPEEGSLISLDQAARVVRRSISDPSAQGQTWELPNDKGDVELGALSGNGRVVAMATAGGICRVYDVQRDLVVRVVLEHDEPVTSLALSWEGGRLVSGDAEGRISWQDIDWEYATPLAGIHQDKDQLGLDGSELGNDPARREDRVEWLPDASSQIDQLGRRGLADVLATRLQRMTDESPDASFLLHLDGAWGSGKSSLLNFVDAKLRPRWLVVEFDAWRQSRVGPPWWALLSSLRRSLASQLPVGRRVLLRVEEAVTRVKRDAGLAPFVLIGMLLAITYAALGASTAQTRAVIALLAALIGSITILLRPARSALAFFMWDSAMGAKRYEQWHRDPMEGLAEHFAWLISRARKPVVFLIDDLDRCSESYVVELLDSVQTLVRDAGPSRGRTHAPCFVVAADGRWIRASYEQQYEGFMEAVSEPGQPLGYLFLDKVFQLTIDVPVVRTLRKSSYLNELLGGRDDRTPDVGAATKVDADGSALLAVAEGQDQREIVEAVGKAPVAERSHAAAAAVARLSEPSVESATEHELQKFSDLLAPNPRAMKRFINAYSMALSSALLEDRAPDPDAVALWTLVRQRWPELADHLRDNPETAESFHSEEPVGSQLPDELRKLAESAPVRAVMTYAPGLDRETIRRLTGLS